MSYTSKYLKYKNKYLDLKFSQTGGSLVARLEAAAAADPVLVNLKAQEVIDDAAYSTQMSLILPQIRAKTMDRATAQAILRPFRDALERTQADIRRQYTLATAHIDAESSALPKATAPCSKCGTMGTPSTPCDAYGCTGTYSQFHS
jgi:hypothetical protein